MNPKTVIETAEARRAERQKGAQQKTMKEAASQYQLDRRCRQLCIQIDLLDAWHCTRCGISSGNRFG